ncbi:TniB family NTP-binding protein [Deinococcus aerolatus]|uniref:TniB family NTP-binding protein n=1 Tax=Deinococcus aerolatus TaxID=522487 RepID=UPI001667FF07|nr:TniB family NTP-binding protein [Deinococcus aerolatus]
MNLTAAAQRLLQAPLNEQITHVRRRRRLNYAAANQFMSRVQNLHQHQYQHRSRCLALTGEQWHGKTTLLDWIHDRAKQHSPHGTPSLRADVAAGWNLVSLYNVCLKSLGAPISLRGDSDRKFDALCKILAKKETNLIILDEFHDVRRCQPRQMPMILSGLRALCNLPGVTVVLSGLPEVVDILRNDPQLSSRFERHQLRKWEDGPEYYAFLATVLSDFPFPEESELLNPDSELASKLLHLGRYRLGAFSVILCEAACLALAAGRPCVTRADIQTVATTFWAGQD